MTFYIQPLQNVSFSNFKQINLNNFTKMTMKYNFTISDWKLNLGSQTQSMYSIFPLVRWAFLWLNLVSRFTRKIISQRYKDKVQASHFYLEEKVSNVAG